MESGISMSVPYQIDVVNKYGFSYRFFFIDFILIFLLPSNHDFGRWKQYLFDILSFTDLQKMYLKKFS